MIFFFLVARDANGSEGADANGGEGADAIGGDNAEGSADAAEGVASSTLAEKRKHSEGIGPV